MLVFELSRSFSFFGAHAHISPMGAQNTGWWNWNLQFFFIFKLLVFVALNFSHRIDHLSFGLPTPGLIQPLNGDLKIANTSRTLFSMIIDFCIIHFQGSQIFQYFLEVVPTVVQTSYANVETYQYAVTEKVGSSNSSIELSESSFHFRF